MRACIGGTATGVTFFSTLRLSCGLYLSKGSRDAPWYVVLAVCATTAAAVVAQTASTTYHGASRDPFDKYKPQLKRKVEKKVTPVAVPPIQARIDSYKAQKLAAMNLQQPAPKP